MVNARKLICSSIFDGEPKHLDFEIKYEELPELRDGGNFLSNLTKFANSKKRIVYKMYGIVLTVA